MYESPIWGRASLAGDCEAQEWGKKILSDDYPKCSALEGREVLYYDNGIKKGTISIFTASNNNGRNFIKNDK